MRAMNNVNLGETNNKIKATASAFTTAGLKANLYFTAITTGVRAITGGLEAIVNRSRELSQLNTALAAFVTTQQNIEGVMAQAKMTAIQYGVGVQSVESAWRRIGPAANAAGMSIGQTNELITAAVSRIAQMGLNAEQSSRFMNTLAQVMGKGKLQGEELTQQFAELDGSLKSQISQAIKALYGIEDLDEAMRAGNVSAGMFAEALIYASKDGVDNLKTQVGTLNEMMEAMNFEQKANTMKNALTRIAEEIGTVLEPAADNLVKTMGDVVGYLSNWAERFPGTTKLIGQAFEFVSQTISLTVQGWIGILELFSQAIETATRDGAKDFIQMFMEIDPVIKNISALMEALGFGSLTEKISTFISDGLGGVLSKNREISSELTTQQNYYDDLKSKVQSIKDPLQGIGTAQEDNNSKVDLEKMKREAVKTELKNIKIQEVALKRALEDKLKELDNEKKKLQEIKSEVKARYDAEIADIRRVAQARRNENQAAISSIQSQKRAAEQNYQAATNAANLQHMTEMNNLDKRKTAAEREKAAALAFRDQVINRIEATRAAEQSQAEQKIALIGNKRDAAIAALDAEANRQETLHNQTITQLQGQVTALQNKEQAVRTAEQTSLSQAQSLYTQITTAMEARYDKEITRIENKKLAVSNAIQNEKDALSALTTAVNARYDAEKRRMDEKMSAVRGSYNAEIARLRELTPAERELKQIEIDKLRSRASNSELSREERLRAVAQLNDMDRQVRIARVEEGLRLREQQHEENLNKLQDAKNKKLQDANQVSASNIEILNAQLTALDTQKDVISTNYQAATKAMQQEYNAKVEQIKAKTKGEIDGITAQIEALGNKEDALNTAHTNEMDRISNRKDKVTAAAEADIKEIEAIEKARDARTTNELNRLKAEKQAISDKYDAEINGIDANKETLQNEHDIAMARRKAEHDAAMARFTNAIEGIKSLDKAQAEQAKADVERLKTLRDAAVARYDDSIKAIGNQETAAKNFATEEGRRLDDLKNRANDLATANENAGTAAAYHAGAVDGMATAYNNYANSLNNAATAARNYKSAIGGGGTTSPELAGAGAQRFAGGPVTGGTTYTVNELGTESFLSAAGRLSKIKAPAFGQWKAPSSGTVVPAHVTSQLNIPSGGTRLKDSGSGVNSYNNGESSTGYRNLIRAIQGLAGGGTTNNNVTIQAANTTQAANDMLVNLNRIKRNRMR